MQLSLPRAAAFAFSLASLAGVSQAQITKAPLSPRAQVHQQIGLVEVDVDYSRPSVRGRKIFGELEPFGSLWRTGANACTTIAFSGDVTLADQDVPAGKYSLFTIPDEKSWTVVLNKNVKLWGAGGYDPAEDLVRFEVPVQRLGDLRESFTIDFGGFHANGGDLVLSWEHTRVRVPVFVDSDERVLAEIDEKVRKAEGEVSAQTYFDAGMFLYEKQLDLKDAAAWIDKAVELSPSSFWMAYYQAELAHVLGDAAKAKRCAASALDLAKQSRVGAFGYDVKCELLLAKLK